MSFTALLFNERGMALPLTLMLVALLTFLGTTALLTTTTDMKIGGNHRLGEQAFYCAQAGIEEARARLRADASNPLTDSHPDRTEWRAYIGSLETAQNAGWAPGAGMHTREESLQSDLDYAVEVRHQTDAAGHLLYWGDTDGDGVNERNALSGENIYVATSFGFSQGADKAIEAEMVRLPPLPVQAALYVEAETVIQGNDAYIIGTDACGDADKPGVVTPADEGSVTISDNPRVVGAGGSEPNILYNGPDLDVESMVTALKGLADYAYAKDRAAHTPSSSPGPGDGWGTPTPGAASQTASACDSRCVVYYDTGGTYVRLSGGVSGCGMLLVEGDLEIEGDFSWYGVVFVTGSVFFTSAGERNITGALMAGGSAMLDLAGGSTSIIYCSDAVADQTSNRPVQLLSWKEKM